jgi:hypothetical protein
LDDDLEEMNASMRRRIPGRCVTIEREADMMMLLLLIAMAIAIVVIACLLSLRQLPGMQHTPPPAAACHGAGCSQRARGVIAICSL